MPPAIWNQPAPEPGSLGQTFNPFGEDRPLGGASAPDDAGSCSSFPTCLQLHLLIVPLNPISLLTFFREPFCNRLATSPGSWTLQALHNTYCGASASIRINSQSTDLCILTRKRTLNPKPNEALNTCGMALGPRLVPAAARASSFWCTDSVTSSASQKWSEALWVLLGSQ